MTFTCLKIVAILILIGFTVAISENKLLTVLLEIGLTLILVFGWRNSRKK